MKSNYITRIGSLGLLLISLYGSAALAQNAAQTIERLEAKQQQLRASEEALRAKSQAISSAMATTEQSDGPGKDAYDEAVATFEEASEQYEKDPSPTNKSRVRNAEFKLHLAERKYRSGNSEMQKLEEQQDAVESQLIAVRRELDEIKEQIPQLRRRVAEQREREKAAQAAAKARENSAQAAAPAAPAATPREETTPASNAVQNNAQAQSAPANRERAEAPAAKQDTTPPLAANAQPIELDRDFTLLTTKAQVLTELANLQLRIGGDSLKIRSNKILNVRNFVDGKETEKNSHRFKGLGNYQYRADATLFPGENRLRVSFSRWNINMPAEYANKQLVILMDAGDRNAPKIICFPADLVDE